MPNAPASGFMTLDNPGNQIFKNGGPPGGTYVHVNYNNRYDPNTNTLFLHFGFGTGSTSQYGYTTQVYQKCYKIPKIYSFTPTQAKKGDTVIIKGDAFNGAVSVKFGGTAASSFTVQNDSTITAVIGTGASGVVAVSTSHASDTLSKFTFVPVLPINLLAFNAAVNNQTIETEWQTSKEINVSHFIVQNSTDGNSFKEIGTVNAEGNGINNYKFIDKKPSNGVNYYRLQTLDKDGTNTYSKTISVNFEEKQFFSMIPNPARNFTIINFSKTVDKATITVYDNAGKSIFTQSLRGTNFYKLNTQNLTNGVYVVKVKTDTSSYNEQLLIKK